MRLLLALALLPAAAAAAGGRVGRAERDCELPELFDRFNSDKTRIHQYGRAYCPLFAPIREKVRSLVELGFLRASGCASFATFFPHAEVYGLDTGHFHKVTPVKNASGATVPGHRGQPIPLGPRADHAHLFISNLLSIGLNRTSCAPS